MRRVGGQTLPQQAEDETAKWNMSMLSCRGVAISTAHYTRRHRVLLHFGWLAASTLAALALIPSVARASGTLGTIEIVGSEATFHVTAPPKEDWPGASWYANAYTDRLSDHCANPAV
jgi:hypothetical protein